MSAVAQVQIALERALHADLALRAYMGKAEYVFSAVAPGGTEFPYIILSGSTENPRNTFARAGFEGTETLVGYSQYTDKVGAAEIYAHMHRILSHRLLTADDGRTMRGEVTLAGLTMDDSRASMRCVALYHPWTR